MGSKKFLIKKMFELKKVGGKNGCGVKENLGQKKFWVKKYLGKNIWAKKILVKIIWVRIFFCLKQTQVGLTQGGGCMTPPPKKIVGSKFCRVIISCPKRFFVKKKKY